MAFNDKRLTCVQYGSEFIYTAGEQELHQSLGYKNEPRRCPDCHQERKRQRDQKRFFGRGRGLGLPSGMKGTFTITCADCGQQATVPFKPRRDRPVYCEACFSKRKGDRRLLGLHMPTILPSSSRSIASAFGEEGNPGIRFISPRSG